MESLFLDLDLSIKNGIVSYKSYDEDDDFNFEIVYFPFLDGDVPRFPSYGVYLLQIIRFAKVSSNVDDFNKRNTFLILSFCYAKQWGQTDHHAMLLLAKTLRTAMTLWRRYGVRKHTLDAILSREI